MIRTSIFFLLLSMPALAQSEIYKCVDADGNLAFQDSPCPEPATEPAIETEAEPDAEPASEPNVAEPALISAAAAVPEDGVSYVPVASNRSASEVEDCKGPHRDAIDEIEAEMLRGYSADQGESYKQELRTLTEAMRACE